MPDDYIPDPVEHVLLRRFGQQSKQRGFIVDYIGLANHRPEALSIYTGEDADDLLKGLKNVSTELPILEERFRRLIQHFSACGVADIERFATEKIKSPEAGVKVIHDGSVNAYLVRDDRQTCFKESPIGRVRGKSSRSPQE